MTYLGFPRLHFAGTFQADVSTVNNDPTHFNNETFNPDFQKLQADQDHWNGWFNPNGTADWNLKCKVTGIYTKDGIFDDKNDPILGQSIAGDNQPGKIVDLDSQQQMVSAIWAFNIQLGDSSEGNSFTGKYDVASFTDIWQRVLTDKIGGDAFYGAIFQSTISSVNWSSKINSPFLNQLKDKDGNLPQTLSIKFAVDGYNAEYGTPNFGRGRVVGVIGPYEDREPKHFVDGRCLRPQSQSQIQFNYAYAKLSSNTLFVDLANSIRTKSPRGPLIDVGPIRIGVLKNNAFTPIGQVIDDYTSDGWYERTSGIVNMPLTNEEVTLVNSNPIAIPVNTEKEIYYLSENSAGAFLRADDFVFRIYPGEKYTIQIYATTFGRRCPNQKINLKEDTNGTLGPTTKVPDQPNPPNPPSTGYPKGVLNFPNSITTNDNGIAEFEITGSDPGNPRVYIDGQVYGITYLWDNAVPDYNSNPLNFISVLLWSAYTPPAKITWSNDVQPILQQYANLYPVMLELGFKIANKDWVIDNAVTMKTVLNLPLDNYMYMPVTRDLSKAKIAMINTWLNDNTHP